MTMAWNDTVSPTRGDIVACSALAVPEPTAWALMILGFGGIGAVVPRRRPRLAAA